MTCTELGIPDYLHKKGRADDDVFDNEDIYRRFIAEGEISDWANDNLISASIFPIKNDSCNRQKYSNSPEDVLYNVRIEDKGKHYFHWGILVFKTQDVDGFNFKIEQNEVIRNFTIRMKHVSLECMYPHSEVLVYENDVLVNENKPKSTKTALRVFLLDKSKIIKYPEKVL